MATAIHTEIKRLAQNNPAAYLSLDFIQALTIDRLLVSIQKITGAEIPAGQNVLSATLESAVFSKPNSARLIKPSGALPNQIGLDLNSDLTVVVKIFVTGDKKKLVSIVTVTVKKIMLLGSYASNIITFEGLDFGVFPNVQRAPNADKVLKDAGIDPLEAARVEGLIAYSAVNSSIRANLGQRKDLLLSTLFPAFDFGTAAQLVPLQSGAFLGIIPDGFVRVESAACKCASGPDIGTSPSSFKLKAPPNPKKGDSLGSVTIGGPIAQNLNPLKDLGTRFAGAGQAGVYMPRVATEGLTVQVIPAIEILASDNGFIGFDARATIGFLNAGVKLDAKNGGILVTFDLDISTQVTCTLDMGCGLRLPIGRALITPSVGSQAEIVMGFYPVVDQSGTIKLRAVLQKADMGQFIAVIIGVGAALDIIGAPAWVGFLIDVVLSAIVSNNLPSALRDQLQKYLGQNEWTLLKFGDLLKSRHPQGKFAALFDVDGDTMLASVDRFGDKLKVSKQSKA